MPPVLLIVAASTSADLSFLNLPAPILAAVGVVFVGGASLIILKFFGECVAIWDRIRSKPASHEIYATKKEVREALDSFRRDLDRSLASIDSRVGSIASKQDSMQGSMQSLTGEVMRALGRLEGTE